MTPQAASAAADNLAPLRPVLARATSASAAQPGAAVGFAAFLMVSVGLPGQANTQQQAPEPPSFPEPSGLSGAPGAVIPSGPAGAPGPAAMPPAPDLGPVLMSAARVPSMDGKAKAMPSGAFNGRQADSTPAASPALEGAVPLPASSALAYLPLQAAAMPAERVPEPPSAAGQDPTREEPPVEPASITAAGGPVEGPVRAAPGAGALAAPSGQPTPGVARPSARMPPGGVPATTAAPPQSAMQPGSRAVAQAPTDRTGPVDALAGHPAPAMSGTPNPMPPDVADPGAEPDSASRGRMPEGPVKPVDPSGPQPAPAAPPRPASTPAAPAFEAPQPAATAVALANAMTGRAAPLEPSESEGKPAEPTDASVPVAGAAVLPRPAAPPQLPVAGPMSPADSPALPLAGQLGPAFTTLAPPAGPARLVVRLDPAELGQVQVGITRPANGPTRVELMAERPDTLLLLMRDQPALHRALDLAGVPAEGRTLHFQIGTPDAASPAPAQQAASGNNLGNNLSNNLGGSGSGQGSPGGAGSGMAGGGQGQPQGWPCGTNSPGNTPAARMRRPGHPQAGIDITA